MKTINASRSLKVQEVPNLDEFRDHVAITWSCNYKSTKSSFHKFRWTKTLMTHLHFILLCWMMPWTTSWRLKRYPSGVPFRMWSRKEAAPSCSLWLTDLNGSPMPIQQLSMTLNASAWIGKYVGCNERQNIPRSIRTFGQKSQLQLDFHIYSKVWQMSFAGISQLFQF